MAKQIVVIDPKKIPVSGEPSETIESICKCTRISIKVDSSAWKAAAEEEFIDREGEKGYFVLTKMNYAPTPRSTMTRPTGFTKPVLSTAKVRREPAPPNDNNIFGKPVEIPKVLTHKICLLIVRKEERPRGTHFLMLLGNRWCQLFTDIKDTWCNSDHLFNAIILSFQRQ